eukprot:SAG31_NODE_28135_length_415_cov_0.648734_2_plen_23_part_01
MQFIERQRLPKYALRFVPTHETR